MACACHVTPMFEANVLYDAKWVNVFQLTFVLPLYSIGYLCGAMPGFLDKIIPLSFWLEAT